MSFNLNSYLDREPIKTFLRSMAGVINYIRILNIQVEIPGEPSEQTTPIIPTPDEQENLDLYLQIFAKQYETEDLSNGNFTPANEPNLDVWMELSAITGTDIPDTDDRLASIPNSGTGSDLFVSDSSARPLYEKGFVYNYRPNFTGTDAGILNDPWQSVVNSFLIASGDRMQLTPVNQNPTYLEGFLVFTSNVSNAGSVVCFAHRSESTRLIQIVYDSDLADRVFFMQLRGSGSSLQTITSVSGPFTITEPHIIYFKFDKAGNNHVLSVNGETPVVSTYNFGSETFNSTLQGLGMFNNGSWNNGASGSYHEFILKYSAIENVESIRRYLWKKYRKDKA